MALSTYSDLKTSIANYLGRSDLTSQIPDFITLAEVRLSRELRIRQMLSNSTIATVGGTNTVSLPSDFLDLRDIYVDGNPRQPISYMTPAAFSRDAQPEFSGKPVYYTINATQFVLAPNPDTNYNIKVLYYAKPTVLSDSNTSNAFLANAPDALLYASLLEAEPYLMNDQRILVWSNLYSNALQALNTADEKSEFSGVPLTMSVSR